VKSRIPVFIKVAGTPSDAEDAAVPGCYLVKVDDDLAEEDRATAALDIFHEHVAIGCLEDFAISAFDELGNSLAEKDEAASYTLGSRGEFCGAVDAVPAPLSKVSSS
jgi:hypothetical protein